MKNKSLIILLIVSAFLRLWWVAYTEFIYEDAHITFRYAENLAEGRGFVYNEGERVYGTTTPLLTLILAAYKIAGRSLPSAAVSIGLIASLWTIGILYKMFEYMWFPKGAIFTILSLIILSDKIIVRDMGGMETPLILLFMAASLYCMVRGRDTWAGVFCGLLLWTRIDTVTWVGLLALYTWWFRRGFPIKLVVTCALVYLPWLIFAQLYFGSIIPYTILAKAHAYGHNQAPIWDRAIRYINFFTPISLPGFNSGQLKWALIFSATVAAVGAYHMTYRKWFLLPPVYFLLESARIIVMGQTFEARYFIPTFFIFLIMFGSGAWILWNRIYSSFRGQSAVVAVGMFFLLCMDGLQSEANYHLDMQRFVYNGSLKPMGEWIDANTPADSSVLLEPLGYAGYYARRHMIDEVGLVSPQVLEFENQHGFNTFDLIAHLQTDYLILHCDDGMFASTSGVHAMKNYRVVYESNPLNFDWQSPGGGFDRAACYQVWERITE